MKRTFRELYEEAKSRPKPMTPAKEFVAEVARLTGRQELAVYNWLAGRQCPDELVRRVIADKYGVDPDGLFPEAEAKDQKNEDR